MYIYHSNKDEHVDNTLCLHHYFWPYVLLRKKTNKNVYIGVLDITKKYPKKYLNVLCGILKSFPYFIVIFPLKIITIFVTIYLSNSKYFDKEYYIKQYRKFPANYNPLMHYLEIGWLNDCNPASSFSTIAYISSFRKQIKDICPLFHYEIKGKHLGAKAISVEEYNRQSLKFAKCDTTFSNIHPNILIITHEMSLSGAPRTVLNMAIRLKQLSYNPVVFSPVDGPLCKEFEKENIKCFVSCHISGETNNRREIEYWRDYVSCFDYVLFNCIVSAEFVTVIKDLPINKKLWIHDGQVGFYYYSPYHDFSKFSDYYDEIYDVGLYVRNVWQKYTHIPMKTLFYGIDDISNSVTNPSVRICNRKTVFLIAGYVCERKGHHILLKSLKSLNTDVLDKIEIIIAGKDYDEVLYNELKYCNIKSLRIIGEIDHEALLSLLNDVDVLLCPSIDDPLPIVCTEAMMLSKPVVVSTNTGTASLIQHGINGFVIKAGDYKELSNTIIDISSINKKDLKRIGKESRKLFDNYFTMSKFDENLLRIFNRIS